MGITAKILSDFRRKQNILRLLTAFHLTDFLWSPPANVSDGDCYDMIIVGGGTAGCLLAGELAQMNTTVLLVEAGGVAPVESFFPALFPYLKGTTQDWNFTSTSCDSSDFEYHRGGKLNMQQGKGLGGSQQVNYLLYGVGNPNDYDNWADITNYPSWSWNNVKPLFIKNERVIDTCILNSDSKKYHGTNGNITLRKYHKEGNEPYFESYRELGNYVGTDINEDHTLGYTNAFVTINGQGIKQSTAYNFLSPQKNYPNLHILLQATATEIIFDENKIAIGLKIYLDNETCITVKVKKEIIITAGAIKSPQLLMTSGIGPKEQLDSIGIEVVSDLPVGQNLHDNPGAFMVYKMGESYPASALNALEYSVTVMEGHVALNKSQKTADYQILSGVVPQPELFELVCASIFGFDDCVCDHYYEALIGRQVHFVSHNLLYSKSRGEIWLDSPDPRANPKINPCYYCDDEDFYNHVKYLKHYNKIVHTKFYKSVDAALLEPKFCEDIERESDEWWECLLRGMTNTLNQYGGTCALGNVVDHKLRVKGVKKVRVAGASVMPTPVGATIEATVMMIAQKLTDILIKDHNLVKQ